MKSFILAIETGGTKIQLALGSPDGDIFFRYRANVEREKGFQGILDAVVSEIPDMKEKAAGLGGAVHAIGIGFGGPVETASGTALWSAQIDGWKNFPVKRYFEEKTGIETFLYNDSNAAAWGEYCKGAGRGSRIFFYTNMGSGVGGGLVLNGELYDGQGTGAAEMGQMYMADFSAKPGEKIKTLPTEKICSGWGIEQKLQNADLPEDSLLWKLCGGKQKRLTCLEWAEAIKKKDGYALQLLEQTAEYFAIALCNMFCFFSPQKVAIGGGVSLIGEPLIERIRKYVEKYVYINCAGRYEIVKSELDEDVVIVGTLLLTGEALAVQNRI